MEPQNCEKWNCEICTTRFDTETVVPLIFKHCGHTACANCIKQIICNSKEENKAYVNCYKCRSTHTFTERECENFMSFPRNFALLQLMERQGDNKECDHKNMSKDIICLDNKCMNKTKCCFICYKLKHLNCLNELVVQSEKFEEQIDVEKLLISELFKSKEIKSTIEKKLTELKERLFSFVDFCEESIKGESRQLENLLAENYFEKASSLKSTFDAQSGKIILSHKNKEFIDVFSKKLNNLLTVDIWNEFKNVENSSLVSNYSYFLKIKTPVLPEDNFLFEKITNTNILLMENFLLKNLDIVKYESQDDYFKKLAECWKVENYPIKDVKVIQSTTIKKEIEIIACDVIKKSFSSFLNIIDIENDISAKFSSQVFYNNSSNWKCRLSFKEPVDFKETECAIMINVKVCNDLYASIFYPKELIPQNYSNRRLSLVDLNHNV